MGYMPNKASFVAHAIPAADTDKETVRSGISSQETSDMLALSIKPSIRDFVVHIAKCLPISPHSSLRKASCL